MKNEFEKYYDVVQEHARDMVGEIFDELVEEMKETSYGYSYTNFIDRHDTFLSEYNNGLYVTLREAVDILEQSIRLINDESLYVGAGDCKEQVQAMAYWTYRNDLRAEFHLALKKELEEKLPEYEADVEKIQKIIHEVEELIEEKENKIEDLYEQKAGAIDDEIENLVLAIDKQLEKCEKEKEELEKEKEELEEKIEEPTNLLDNAEKIIGEIN